jgi:hypothetical protein
VFAAVRFFSALATSLHWRTRMRSPGRASEAKRRVGKFALDRFLL